MASLQVSLLPVLCVASAEERSYPHRPQEASWVQPTQAWHSSPKPAVSQLLVANLVVVDCFRGFWKAGLSLRESLTSGLVTPETLDSHSFRRPRSVTLTLLAWPAGAIPSADQPKQRLFRDLPKQCTSCSPTLSRDQRTCGFSHNALGKKFCSCKFSYYLF